MSVAKRPRIDPTQLSHHSSSASTSSSSSSQLNLPPALRYPNIHKPIFTPLKFYILPQKFATDEVTNLYNEIQQRGGGTVCNPWDADVVVSRIMSWKRLERNLTSEGRGRIRSDLKVVREQWVWHSIVLGRKVGFGDKVGTGLQVGEGEGGGSGSRDGVVTLGKEDEVYEIRPRQTTRGAPASTTSEETEMGPPTKSVSHLKPEPPDDKTGRPTSSPDPNSYAPRYTSRYACQRFTPLVCVNQGLVEQLKLIKQSRELEGDSRSALSYARAISVIKAYPNKIESASEAAKLSGVGVKVENLISEYLSKGHLSEASNSLESPRLQVLRLFTTIHGVGPSTARRLYDQGLRTIEDIRKWNRGLGFGGDGDVDEEWDGEGEYCGVGDGEDGKGLGKSRRVKEEVKGKVREKGAPGKVYLKWWQEMQLKIPRSEVEQIAKTVKHHLDVIEPGCEYTVVGGYRRGKQESNDVDIVVTHPEDGKEKGLLRKLVQRLKIKGIISDVLYYTEQDSKRGKGYQHFHATGVDPLDKAFTFFVQPPDPAQPDMKRLHRRVDLIFAGRKYYATAVLGWTGSIQFERDLRLWAEHAKEMKFDSGGIFRRHDNKEFIADTEEDVFEILGLDYVPPELRNAD